VSEPAGDGAKIHAGVDEFGRRVVAERVESGASESPRLVPAVGDVAAWMPPLPTLFVGTELAVARRV
jgi:hypothetical protein